MASAAGQLEWIRRWATGLAAEMRRLQLSLDAQETDPEPVEGGEGEADEPTPPGPASPERPPSPAPGAVPEVPAAEPVTAARERRGTLSRERSTNSEGNSPKRRHPLLRDSSQQSDGTAASRCSSVESLLESRRVDAEAVLRGVGFGPSPARQQLARIPDRFLKPSMVKGINTEQFIKEEHKSMKMHECGVFGYRGLTGNPHSPPSTIVAKIIERISSCEELPESLQFGKTSPF